MLAWLSWELGWIFTAAVKERSWNYNSWGAKPNNLDLLIQPSSAHAAWLQNEAGQVAA